jgi:acyl carrier protein
MATWFAFTSPGSALPISWNIATCGCILCVVLRNTSDMTFEKVRSLIESILNRLLRQKGLQDIRLENHMQFLGQDIPIDSLDLAALLTELEQATQKDPFKGGFVNFKTVAELAALYAD